VIVALSQVVAIGLEHVRIDLSEIYHHLLFSDHENYGMKEGRKFITRHGPIEEGLAECVYGAVRGILSPIEGLRRA
jgi:hypothetical protein